MLNTGERTNLRALELESGREQIVVDRKQLSLQMDVANNLEPLECCRRSRALHLRHDCSLELGVAAQRGHLTFLSNTVLGGPLLSDISIWHDDSHKHALAWS